MFIEEIAKLESSRQENEATIAALESDKWDQERQIDKLKEELQAQRQELDQKDAHYEKIGKILFNSQLAGILSTVNNN